MSDNQFPIRQLSRAAASIILALFAASACAAASEQDQVKIAGGVIEGTSVPEGVRVFKGIPFAEPPVGDLRWKPPQAVKPWEGVKKTQSFGPAPMQNAFVATMLGVPPNFSEDCLYLNVWTPAKAENEHLPVMVWIYGGAFVVGGTSQAVYDGGSLAQKGVAVVSVAYRLGPFGFLAHPDLSSEGDGHSGNYGLMDQIAGLQWVRDNIAAFGGDPKCVTIFGESAGGISVSMLAASPKAKGLFQRAISESGGSFAPSKAANEGGELVVALPVAEKQGQQFLSRLGANNLAEARRLAAADVLKGSEKWQLISDGAVLMHDSYELYEAGRFNDTPVLIGTNSDEGAMFARHDATSDNFSELVRAQFGKYSDDILAVYPHATQPEAYKATKDLFRDSAFAWHTWTWAKLQSEKGQGKVYVYYFDQHPPENPDGANHAAELPFVFGKFVVPFRGARDGEHALSETMQAYWVNFARAGDPNGNGLPEWPSFTATAQNVMRLDAEPQVQSTPNRQQLDVLDAYFAWRRAEARSIR